MTTYYSVIEVNSTMFTTATPNHVQKRTNPDRVHKSRFGFSNLGELPIIGVLVGLAGGMISLIVMFSLVPVIGASVDDAMPATDGDWNTTTNTDLPTGLELWEQIGPLIVLCALIAVIMVVLKLLGVF